MEGFERNDDGDSMKDRISDLPNSLIDRILDRLSFENAVKTCVLSKRWRYCWTRVRRIIFDKYGYNTNLDKRLRLKGIINSTLLRHEGPIHEFVVYSYIDRDYSTMFQINVLEEDRDIHRWMQLLVDNGIQRLKFLADVYTVPLPSRILNCSTLTHLSLRNCELRPPEDFMGVGYLVDLRLSHVYISDKLLKTIIASSALLTVLVLDKLYFVPDGGCVVINAPFLKELHVWQLPVPRLDHFFLTMPKIEILKIYEAFSSLSSLASGDHIPMKLPSLLQNLKDLEFFNLDMSSLSHMACVFCLIRSSPNLKSLSISVLYPDLYFLGEEDFRAEGGGFYDAQEGEGISSCLSNVRIYKLVGLDCEVRFISSLLKYCTMLETVSVSPNGHFPYISAEQLFEKIMKL